MSGCYLPCWFLSIFTELLYESLLPHSRQSPAVSIDFTPHAFSTHLHLVAGMGYI